MLPAVVLPTDCVVLRPFRLDDVADVAAGCSDPLTQRFLPLLPYPYTLDDARWWVEVGAPAAFAAGGAGYALTDPLTGRVLGGIGIGRARETGSAEIGYWVAPWGRRRGVATAATRALTAHAFAHGTARLELLTEPENGPSQRVAIGAGYAREGVQRGGGASRGGGRHDLVVWARLATDPPGPTPRRLPDLPGGELTDGVVTLRPLAPADTDDLLALCRLPEVVASSVPPATPTREQMEHRCARSEAAWLAGQRAMLTIRDSTSGDYAGDIGLYCFESAIGEAMIGYSLLPAWRGRGFATRAAVLVSRWAFEGAGFSRVVAGTAPTNLGSQRVLERAGFQREGYQRAKLPGPHGTRIDDLLYALLPPESPQDKLITP